MTNWYPQPRLLWSVFALAATGISIPFFPEVATIWKGVAALLAGSALFDLLQIRRTASPTIVRQMPTNLPMAAETKVRLQLRNNSETVVKTLVHDRHPSEFNSRDMPQSISLQPSIGVELIYTITPPHRGDAFFPGTELLLLSPFGLWRQRRRIKLETAVKVYPNFAEISNYTLLATDNRLSQIGVKRRQRRGEGSDFLQLREYRQGDSQRQIHWQASARLRKLISKEYQDEKNQQIIFLLDCGRRMRHQDQNRAHLDQALNAILLLSYVAVHQGDSVGVMTLGGKTRWIPPRSGQGTVKRLLESLYDLQSTTMPADYLDAVNRLDSLQRRRALIVAITNTRNEDHSDLLAAISQLRKRHLVVLADLREEMLDEVLVAPIGSRQDALRFHAVQQYMDEREKQHMMLHHYGAITLDITASQLPISLVNQYLEIKGSARL